MFSDTTMFKSFRDKCSNCCSEFHDLEKEKFVNIKVNIEVKESKDIRKVKIFSAITKMFEVPWIEFFAKYLAEVIDTDTVDKCLNDIGLCQQCETILSQMYECFLKFEKLCESNSLIMKAKLFRGKIEGKRGEFPSCDSKDNEIKIESHSEDEWDSVREDSTAFPEINQSPVACPELDEDNIGNVAVPVLNAEKVEKDCHQKKIIVKLQPLSYRTIKKFTTRSKKKHALATRMGSKHRKNDLKDCGIYNSTKDGTQRRKADTLPRKFECESCEKVFSMKKLLMLHEKLHKREDTKNPLAHPCTICGKSYTTLWYLKTYHMKMHEEKLETVSCNVCGDVFKSKYNLNIHTKRKHTADEEVKPQDIPGELLSKAEKKHKAQHKTKRFKCEIGKCKKTFPTQILLDAHLQKHNINVPALHECQICGKFFKTLFYLKSCHMKRHEGIKEVITTKTFHPATCGICGQVLKSKLILSNHMKLKHSTDEEKAKLMIQCELCGKMISKYYMKEHTSVMHSERFKCDKCNQSFESKSLLYQHIVLRHEDGKEQMCTFCGKSFYLEKELNSHLKQHKYSKRAEKNHQCEECGKKFSQLADLHRHKNLVHSNDRPCVCEECGKSFKIRTQLTKHMKCHLEEQEDKEKFKCGECGKYLKHSLGLYRHQVKYHRPDLKKKVYECHFCFKRFAANTGLKFHTKVCKNKTEVPNYHDYMI